MSNEDITSRELKALETLLASLPAPAPASDALKDRLDAVSSLPQDSQSAPAANAAVGSQSGSSIFWPVFQALFGNATPRSLIPQAAGLTMACLVGGVALGMSTELSGFASPAETILQVDPTAYVYGDPGLEQDLEEMD